MACYVLDTDLPAQECRRRLEAATAVSRGLSWDDSPRKAVQCRIQLDQTDQFQLRFANPAVYEYWRVLSGRFEGTAWGTRITASTRLPRSGLARAVMWILLGALWVALGILEPQDITGGQLVRWIALPVAALVGVLGSRFLGRDNELVDFLEETVDASSVEGPRPNQRLQQRATPGDGSLGS